MSLTTGKVLDYTTRVKTCRFCDYAKTNNKVAKVHDCRKNHLASSKAMEPDSAVQMFNKAPKQNVKYSIYTGDDDSTTEAHIQQKVSYGVEKLSDIIHMKRSVTTRLYNLSQNGKFPDSSTLSQKVINYLVKCFSYSIAQNKGNPKGVQAAIRCIFHMHLVNMKTVTLLGVVSKKIQFLTNTKIFHVEKTFLEQT